MFPTAWKSSAGVPTSGLIYSLMTAEIDGRRLSDEEVIANTIVTLLVVMRPLPT